MGTYSKIKGDTALYLPVGTLMPWSKASTPAGFLYCNGDAVSRTDYADLFDIVGTVFGSGDGVNTFNLPDFSDRAPIGASNNRGFGTNNNAALADQTPTIAFPSATRNMSVTDNINVTASANVPIQAHKHHMASNETNLSGVSTASANSQVRVGGGTGDTNQRYVLSSTNSSANRGQTSNPIGGGGNGAHTHNIAGNVTASFNQTNLTANASAIDVENPYLAIRYVIKF